MWRVNLAPSLVLFALVACAPEAEPPDAGPPSTFTEVYDAFFPVETLSQCNKCHSNPPNDISNGNLSMGADQATAYAALIDRTSTSSNCGGERFVVAGDPDASLFYVKTQGTPACGGRMPLGGNALSDEQRQMIRTWIENGAQDD